MQDFPNVFGAITDPRRSKATRHNLHEMLMIAHLSVLSGGENCTNMAEYGKIKEGFLLQFMTLEHGTPCHDAFSDLFKCFDPDELAVSWCTCPGVGPSGCQPRALMTSSPLMEWRCAGPLPTLRNASP